MVLGSDVPLERDILKRKTEFYITWTEWAARNRSQIIASGAVASGTTQTIFTVPESDNLYITSCWAATNSSAGATSAQQGSLQAVIDGGFQDLLLVKSAKEAGAGNNNLTFPSPILVRSGDTVRVRRTSTTNTFIDGGFTGFLSPKKITT